MRLVSFLDDACTHMSLLGAVIPTPAVCCGKCVWGSTTGQYSCGSNVSKIQLLVGWGLPLLTVPNWLDGPTLARGPSCCRPQPWGHLSLVVVFGFSVSWPGCHEVVVVKVLWLWGQSAWNWQFCEAGPSDRTSKRELNLARHSWTIMNPHCHSSLALKSERPKL